MFWTSIQMAGEYLQNCLQKIWIVVYQLMIAFRGCQCCSSELTITRRFAIRERKKQAERKTLVEVQIQEKVECFWAKKDSQAHKLRPRNRTSFADLKNVLPTQAKLLSSCVVKSSNLSIVVLNQIAARDARINIKNISIKMSTFHFFVRKQIVGAAQQSVQLPNKASASWYSYWVWQRNLNSHIVSLWKGLLQ